MSVRSDDVLQNLHISEWTEEEGYTHVMKTFDLACKNFPDLMETYAIRMADIFDRKQLMRLAFEGLRETRWERLGIVRG